MRLEDMFPSRRRNDDPLEMLAAQIGDLRRQTRDISRALSHNAGDVAGDLGELMTDWGRDAARQDAWLAGAASRKAVQGARAVQRDPVPLLAVLGTAVLLTSLLSSRRR
jgi:hypothetical protein